jgi:hypothetical protein
MNSATCYQNGSKKPRKEAKEGKKKEKVKEAI